MNNAKFPQDWRDRMKYVSKPDTLEQKSGRYIRFTASDIVSANRDSLPRPGLPKAAASFFRLRQFMLGEVRLSLGDIMSNLFQMVHIAFGIEWIHAYLKRDALFAAYQRDKGIDINFLFQYAEIRVAGSSLFGGSNLRSAFSCGAFCC